MDLQRTLGRLPITFPISDYRFPGAYDVPAAPIMRVRYRYRLGKLTCIVSDLKWNESPQEGILKCFDHDELIKTFFQDGVRILER